MLSSGSRRGGSSGASGILSSSERFWRDCRRDSSGYSSSNCRGIRGQGRERNSLFLKETFAGTVAGVVRVLWLLDISFGY